MYVHFAVSSLLDMIIITHACLHSAGAPAKTSFTCNLSAETLNFVSSFFKALCWPHL